MCGRVHPEDLRCGACDRIKLKPNPNHCTAKVEETPVHEKPVAHLSPGVGVGAGGEASKAAASKERSVFHAWTSTSTKRQGDGEHATETRIALANTVA